MLRIFFTLQIFLLTVTASASTILVTNNNELTKANNLAKPGDSIILANGIWNNVTLILNCTGTKEQPITVKSQTPANVFITGNSRLFISGSYIQVEGLYFTNGYTGNKAVITFKENNTTANNCRVTNTVINDFNNPERLKENYWIALYGKNNRIDHCSFINKKNIGVLLAVILEDDRSRENYHSIDHNYFGKRPPLASNGGEIIRVGVSEHCEFNSNTIIADNFFEQCDGETEIISIKSCKNLIRNNLFKECQGSVVLRHGNFNTVYNNVFWGNDKEGTGGVRIINKGQWVVNNFFYKCRGTGFRSPLSIMNGVPNSPAYRYVAVSDAFISNNSFYECSPLSFCEGSDAERSVQPNHVLFINNIFYNKKDSIIYHAFDNIEGIHFINNFSCNTVNQNPVHGFIRKNLTTQKTGSMILPVIQKSSNFIVPDSIRNISMERISSSIHSNAGFSGINILNQINKNALSDCGAKWFTKKMLFSPKKTVEVNCKTADEIAACLTKYNNAVLLINLTGNYYRFSNSLNIDADVTIKSTLKTTIKFSFADTISTYLFQLKGGNSLSLLNLNLDLNEIKSTSFITTDISGNSNHSNFSARNCTINKLTRVFLKMVKSSVADSIVVNNCNFKNCGNVIFSAPDETDNKGYYNFEHLHIEYSLFKDCSATILEIVRSGNDESTMGPTAIIKYNSFISSNTYNPLKAVISMNGVQKSVFEKNIFNACNEERVLIEYKDTVRASHLLKNNTLIHSGNILTNKYVRLENNK